MTSAQYKFTTVPASEREKRALMGLAALECPGALDSANRGAALWHAKEYEKSIEKYRAAVEMSHEVGGTWLPRSYVVSGLGSALRSVPAIPDEDDVKLFWRIGQGKYNDAAHTRAQAYQEGGLAAWHRSDRQQCARFYNLCLAITVSSDEGEAIAMNASDNGNPDSRVRIELATIQGDVRTQLRNLDGITFPDENNDVRTTDPGRPDAGGTVRGPRNPLLATFVMMSLRLSKPDECDECGLKSTTSSSSSQRFLTCRRCKARYYCSPQCQKAAWDRPGGHQACCRAPGKLRPGDLAQLRNLVKSHDLNGIVVKVNADPQPIDRFSVTVQPLQSNDGRTLSVKPENLVYLSPELRWPDRTPSNSSA